MTMYRLGLIAMFLLMIWLFSKVLGLLATAALILVLAMAAISLAFLL